MNNEKLIALAKSFILENRSEWKSELSLPAKVEDKGAHWEVSFELPDFTLGGTPVIEIDKTSNTVTKAYHTQ